MSNVKQTIAVAASATMLLTGAMPAFAATVDAPSDQNGVPTTERQDSTRSASSIVQVDAAVGTFSWDQATITPNEVIKQVFAKAANALCNSRVELIADNPLGWRIAVTGDVSNAYSATVDELAGEQAVSQTMTCSCGGNPADGKAIITADVKGLPVNYLIERASARTGVNAVTFVSSDGTEIAMPLGYVVGRHAVISYELNGEDLSASVGGNNQLWLEGASANYFVRDIVEIRVTREAEPPVKPGEGMDYPNSPNVGVLSASAADVA